MIKTIKKSIQNKRRNSVVFACFALMTVSFVACKKKNYFSPTTFISPEELLSSGGIDTFSLQTSSVIYDSLATDNQPSVVLGNIHDPKFGTSKASFYSQFTFEGSFLTAAGTGFTIDSVVLSLKYSGYYGNLTEQSFEVHELSQDLDIEEDYKQNDVVGFNPINIMDASSMNQIPDPNNKVVLAVGDTVSPQLRLRLNNTFGQNLINEAINGTAFDTESAFKTFFKGLKVSSTSNPTSGDGAALFFDLNSNNSKITVYYKLATNPTAQEKLDLKISSTCADFTHVDVVNTGYDIVNVLANPTLGLEQFYVQNFNARAFVGFSGANAIPKNALIHGALLELPIAYQTGNEYLPAGVIFVGRKTDEGKIVAFKIVQYDNNRKSYVIDLRDYFQEISTQKIVNDGLYIWSATAVSRLERIIFNGQGTSFKSKPKLTIKYTEF